MTNEDVVGIFDEGGTQMFVTARSMRLQTSRSSKTMQHPLETGATVVDHRITLPTEATLMLVLQAEDYRTGYSELSAAFNAGTLFTVQCKADSFASMYISDLPHEESPDQFDAITILLKLTEAQFFKSQAQATNAKPRNSKSSNTAKRGEQSPRSSVAYDIFH